MKNRCLLSLGLLLSLVACTPAKETNVLSSFHTGPAGLNYQSQAFVNHSFSFDMEPLRAKYAELNNAIEAQDFEKTKKALYEANSLAGELVDTMQFARIKYYASSDSSYKENYRTLSAQYIEYYDLDDESLYKALEVGNQQIIDFLFASYSEEEKAEYTGASSRSTELYEKILEIEDEALELTADPESPTFVDDAIDLFFRFAPIANEYASIKGYEDYLKYTYKVKYKRDYLPSDASNLTSKIKEIVVPTYKPADFSFLSEEETQKVYDATNLSFAHENVDFGKYLDEYADFMQGSYLDSYKHAFTEGYVVFSDSNKSQGTAANALLNMESENILYFSRTHQAPRSVLHEFGHYQAYVGNSANKARSFDINETFSIGNEIIFSNYMAKKYDTNFFKAFREKEIDRVADIVFLTSYAVDIENYLFSNYTALTKDQIKDGIRDINEDYPISVPENYWVYPVLSSCGYYISYATSAIESLQLCEQAEENVETARNNYLALSNNKENISDVELWKKSGLESPFEASTLQKVAEIFTKR